MNNDGNGISNNNSSEKKPEESIYIDGIGISNFRSFGEQQLIGPFNKINLFIGKNNSGKSNILRFLTTSYIPALRSANSAKEYHFIDPLDKPKNYDQDFLKFSFGLKKNSSSYKTILEKCDKRLRNNHLDLIDRILNSTLLTLETALTWFEYEGNLGEHIHISKRIRTRIGSPSFLNERDWTKLLNIVNQNHSGGTINRTDMINLTLSPIYLDIPKVDLIPAIRKIGDAGTQFSENDKSGTGIIELLAKHQNPGINEQKIKERFNQINIFLRQVTDNQTAEIEIPNVRDMIIVHMDGKTLPLANLGTGIHEVIMLATWATLLQKQVICIEEPELHLHPLLQKKLIHYLQEKTNNQYFITTHSAHLLDTPEASIFHVRLEDGHTTVEYVTSSSEKTDICADLGYRASDILQTNCIIWVEGPSDRIYLNYWIHQVDETLIEGIHYSIMFYGGRLLSHLSADDSNIEETEIENLISLRRLNRYMMVVMDSDKDSSHKKINATKTRVRKEFDNHEKHGFAWVTQGREIENYIPKDILELAVNKVHLSATELVDYSQFGHCLYYRNRKEEIIKKGFRKVKIAQEVVKQEPNLDKLNLKEMVRKTVKIIKKANGMVK
ncbi:MAG: ATP-binding protein [Anaerolineaceae bacterium]|nr:ATP-binding protein [Anaerolineaceae bacterium]